MSNPSTLSPEVSSVAPRILLVKLSSLGDVLHNLPIVWDLRARLPNAQIDWVVEEGYVHLLKPLQSSESFRGIDRIIPFALRRWKKHIFKFSTWQEFFSFKKQLQDTSYDIIIETQGLLKSALVCALASKTPNAVIAGLGNATEFSGYEPIARYFYSQSVQVPSRAHAVDRSRLVMCSALNWPTIERQNTPQFFPDSYIVSLDKFSANVSEGFNSPYILCFHSTAREAKRWSNENWIALGKALAIQGYQVVYPWGNADERAVSMLIASEVPGALVPNVFSIEDAFFVIKQAALTIGVDTGLTHLAAVLDRPTIEIYCDSPLWKTEGYWSSNIRNLGDMHYPPSVDEVLETASALLQ